MTIFVNGESKTLRDEATVAELLAEMKIAVRHVAVELNLEIVPRSAHAHQKLRDGDRLEVVTLVGGG